MRRLHLRLAESVPSRSTGSDHKRDETHSEARTKSTIFNIKPHLRTVTAKRDRIPRALLQLPQPHTCDYILSTL